MSWKLKWAVELVQTDSAFNPCGASHRFEGSAVAAADVPSASDVTAMLTAMSTQVTEGLTAAGLVIGQANDAAPLSPEPVAAEPPEPTPAVD